MMTEIIDKLVQDLAVANRDLDAAIEVRDTWIEDFNNTPETVHLVNTVEAGKEHNLELRSELQKAIKERFAETGDKQVHPAASIAMRKVYDFDNDEVITWCIAHDHPKLLKLNMPAVKKMVDVSDIPVVVTETPSTRISTDLSEYIVEDTPDA